MTTGHQGNKDASPMADERNADYGDIDNENSGENNENNGSDGNDGNESHKNNNHNDNKDMLTQTPSNNVDLTKHKTTQPLDKSSRSTWALICAAGAGQRAGGEIPKQYQDLNGAPMLWHTLLAFLKSPLIERVFIVLSPEDGWFEAMVAPLLKDFQVQQHQTEQQDVKKVEAIFVGAASRAQSVCNALGMMDEAWCSQMQDRVFLDALEPWVMVHDAARPCISPNLIESLHTQMLNLSANRSSVETLGVILALPVADTLKQVQDKAKTSEWGMPMIGRTIDRQQLWQAQTPQMFLLPTLYNVMCDALQDRVMGHQITDEASAMEWAGHAPFMLQSHIQNMKVTYPSDFLMARAVLGMQTNDDESVAKNS